MPAKTTPKKKVVKTLRRSKREVEQMPEKKPLEFRISKSISGNPISMELFESWLESRKYMARRDKEGNLIEVPRTRFYFCQNLITGEWASVDESYGTRIPIDSTKFRTFSFLGYGVKGGFDWSYDVNNHPWLGGNIHIFMTEEFLNSILLPKPEVAGG